MFIIISYINKMFELYIFAILITLFLALGLNVIISQNPVYSILYLVLFFITGSSLLALFGFDYLSLIFILVYVGAIAVLFLFVIMILDIKVVNKSGFDASIFVLLSFVLFFFPLIYYISSLVLYLQNVLSDLILYFTYMEYNLINNNCIILFRDNIDYTLIDNDLSLNLRSIVVKSLYNLEIIYLDSYLFIVYKLGFYEWFMLLKFCFCEYGFTAPDSIILLYESSYIFKIDYQSSVKNFQVLYTDFMSLFVLCGGVLLVAMISCISLALPVRQQLPDKPIRHRFKE